MLKNYMEELIEIYYPMVRTNYDNICECEKCINDIKAIALNHLQALYFVTEQGEAFSKVNELGLQFKVNIIEELAKAMNIVSQNPRDELSSKIVQEISNQSR